MPHIALPENLPGITADFAFRPETAKPMRELAEVLLRGPSTLTSAERELIATYVSSETTATSARPATELPPPRISAIAPTSSTKSSATSSTPESPPNSKPCSKIAGQVQQGGKNVTAEAVEHARNLGATDLEIHDTVLIAAAFCMYNRYVDGLATWQPQNAEMYASMGRTSRPPRLSAVVDGGARSRGSSSLNHLVSLLRASIDNQRRNT